MGSGGVALALAVALSVAPPGPGQLSGVQTATVATSSTVRLVTLSLEDLRNHCRDWETTANKWEGRARDERKGRQELKAKLEALAARPVETEVVETIPAWVGWGIVVGGVILFAGGIWLGFELDDE